MITIEPTTQGGFKFVANLNAGDSPTGKRIRRFAKTLKEAKERVAELEVFVTNAEGCPTKLTASGLRDALEATRLLTEFEGVMNKSATGPNKAVTLAIQEEHQLTMTAATNHYVKYLKSMLRGRPLGEVQDIFMTQKRKEISHKAANNTARYFGYLNADFPSTRNSASITRSEMITAFNGLSRFDPHTLKGIHSAWNELFDFAFYNLGCVTSNPLRKLPLPKIPKKKIVYLSVERTEKLMNGFVEHDPMLVVPHALGAFAGIRDCEARRMDWSHIDMETRAITVTIDVVKETQGGGEGRTVTMSDNLYNWLLPCVQTGGLIVPMTLRTYLMRRASVLNKIKFGAWPSNCLRKSFATHHKAFSRDRSKTQHEMGHCNGPMLDKWYAAHVPYVVGKAFFNIYPPKDWGKGSPRMMWRRIIPFAGSAGQAEEEIRQIAVPAASASGSPSAVRSAGITDLPEAEFVY